MSQPGAECVDPAQLTSHSQGLDVWTLHDWLPTARGWMHAWLLHDWLPTARGWMHAWLPHDWFLTTRGWMPGSCMSGFPEAHLFVLT